MNIGEEEGIEIVEPLPETQPIAVPESAPAGPVREPEKVPA